MIPKKLKILQLDSGGEKYIPYARSIAMSMPEGTFWQRKFGSDTVKVQVHSGVAQVWIEIPQAGDPWILAYDFVTGIYHWGQAERVYDGTALEPLPDEDPGTPGVQFSQIFAAGFPTVNATTGRALSLGTYFGSPIWVDYNDLRDPSAATFVWVDASADMNGTWAADPSGNVPEIELRGANEAVYAAALQTPLSAFSLELAVYNLTTQTYSRKFAGTTVLGGTSGGLTYAAGSNTFLNESGWLRSWQEWDTTNTRVVTAVPAVNRTAAGADPRNGIAYAIYHGTTLQSVYDVNSAAYNAGATVEMNRAALYAFSDGTNDYAVFANCGRHAGSSVDPHYITYAAGSWGTLTAMSHDFVGDSRTSALSRTTGGRAYASADRSVRVGAFSSAMTDTGEANRTRIMDVDAYNENVFSTKFIRTATQNLAREVHLDFVDTGSGVLWATLRNERVDDATNIRKGIFLQVYWNANLLGSVEQSTPTMEVDGIIDMKLSFSGATATVRILYKVDTDTVKEWVGNISIDTSTPSMDAGAAPWGSNPSTQPTDPLVPAEFARGGYLTHGRDG